MAKAGHAPGVRGRKEFTRMGQEKLEALGESLIGMAVPLYTLNLELASIAARQWWQWWSPWTTLGSLTASRTPVQVAETQAALLRNLAAAAGDKRLADAFSRVVQKGLAPVHRRATGNAKRLRGVKRR
jgi:hypothetical protein